MKTQSERDGASVIISRRQTLGGNGEVVVEKIAPKEDPPMSKGRPHVTSAANRTRVAEAMTRNVVCVRGDLSIEALTALFLDRGISGAPVVDSEGTPIGVVSKTDVLRERYENGDTVEIEVSGERERESDPGFHSSVLARGTVADIMSRTPFTLMEHAPLSQAAALMAVEEVHRVPIVSSEGKVVGILSSLDVLRWLAEYDGYLSAGS